MILSSATAAEGGAGVQATFPDGHCGGCASLGALTAAAAMGGSAASSHAGTAQSPIATQTLDGVARHLVRSGETLRVIAQRYGVGLQELAASNRIVDPDRIYVGQSLRIPR